MAGVPDETRPSPYALLKAAQKETRGKFKIFLGAAPGVGKTYEMLLAARRRREEGFDVMIGAVEADGRAEGKVYVREQAQRTMKHYFQPGNLTALRELALRRTAERVDDQMLSYMREHAITGPWGAGERVVVCIDSGPDAANTVRAAKRTAQGLDAELIALYVETDRHALLSDAEQARLAEALRLAEQLGA